MAILKILRKKRAISPVIATVLLISLVVVAGSLVYFLVMPLLRGSAGVEFLTAQWFDGDSDNVVDRVYITIQNSGTATARITDINIIIKNSGTLENGSVITNAQLADGSFPLELAVSERKDIVMVFDPTNYVALGTNSFEITIYYGESNFVAAPENLKHTDVVESLSIEILNPANGSWVSGILDPQVVRTGGYKPTIVKYNFTSPSGTSLLTDKPYTENIDTTLYSDGYNYSIVFYTSDYLGQSVTKTILINIDNTDPSVTLQLNSTDYNQGDFVGISWTVTGIDVTAGDSPLINQTLTLTGTKYAGETLYTDDGSSAQNGVPQNYVLNSTKTLSMKEDTYTVTIYLKDSGGNTISSGKDFNLHDLIPPDTHFITPENDTTISGDLVIEVYASDVTGIDTNRFTIDFIDPTNGQIEATYSQLSDEGYNGTAEYNTVTKTWRLVMPSIILPNKQLLVVARVYDTATTINFNSTSLYITVRNIVIEGVSASLPYTQWGYYNYLMFFIKNIIFDTLTIKNATVIWTKSGLTGYYYLYSYTTGYWLSYNSGLYDNGTTYDTTANAYMESGSIHQMLITFPWGQDLRNCQLKIFFGAQEIKLSEYLLITIDSQGEVTIETILY